MMHTFIERCYILNPIVPTYLVLAGCWILVGVAWWIWTFVTKKQHTQFLQKILMLIPACKFFDTMINGFFYNACPWLGA
jgi:hypothetical protein